MARMRKPITKTSKEEVTEPKKRNVKKDTLDIIESVFSQYVGLNCKMGVFYDFEKNDKSMTIEELALCLKQVREAQKALRVVRESVRSLRNTLWRKVMLEHLVSWETQLDNQWEVIINCLG